MSWEFLKSKPELILWREQESCGQPGFNEVQAEHLGQQSGPNRDAFVRQLTEPSLVRGGGEAAARSAARDAPSPPPPPGSPKQEADTPPAPPEKQRGASKQDFQPKAWRPGA